MRRMLPLLLLALAAACGKEEPRDELKSLAQKQTSCQTAGDCCVVMDDCMATGYVVGAGDYEHALDLVDGLDNDVCVGCITPLVELSCVEGQCTGTASYPGEPGAPDVTPGAHCGATESTGPAPIELGESPASGRILGCGAD